MKAKSLFVVAVSSIVVLTGVIVAAAQGPKALELLHVPLPAGTGFTYQGQLKSSGAPVNATCAFKFTLFDASTSGNEVGSVISRSILVSNGLFTTVLDFGAGAFTGDARWLDMQLQCPTDGGYIPLTPRQALTPAPMALALPGLWTQQNATSPNLIGGFSGNVISPSVVGATIGGGGANGAYNFIDSPGDWSTISGGRSNTTCDIGATVGGGQGNTACSSGATVGGGAGNSADTGTEPTVSGGANNHATGDDATVAGGIANTAWGIEAVVGGGTGNTAGGFDTVVGGGSSNFATSSNSTVPGGKFNVASGNNSFAAGQRANTNGKSGAFVWGDNSVQTEISATAPYQFLVRAAGGVGINTNTPITSGLTVNGQIVAGGTAYPPGGEPFTSEGSTSGLSLDDRSGGGFPRWVIFPQGGELRFFNAGLGNVVRISSGGALTASGGFNGLCLKTGQFQTSSSNACNMDVAEAFATTDRTEPGDVVALVTQSNANRPPAAGPTVQKAARADGTLVVGVVSTNPGLVFDNGQTHLAGDNSQLITADRTVVALVGRVPVKVSLENGPIAVGDPLTAASAAGSAMKATQAGQILGYALQSSDEASDGKLLAWLQPGLYVPPQALAQLNAGPTDANNALLARQVAQLQTRNAALEQQNAAMDARLTALEQARPADGSVPIAWLPFGAVFLLGVVAWRKRL